MNKILTLLALFFSLVAFSQEEDAGLLYKDHVYIDDLKSVKFYPSGYLVDLPVLYVRDPVPLVLSFDDVSGDDIKDYTYTVVHCDADWTPSRLAQMEYVDGFDEDRIENFEYSFKANSVYTHYWLNLPNEFMTFTKSGNYLLKVYEDEDEKRLAITRRFIVVDPQVEILARSTRPGRVSKIQTHHEIDFTVVHKDFDIRSPQQEISAVVLQNNRWDNAIAGIKPLFSRLEEQSFDYQDKVVFPAGKEFRYLDLRGLRFKDPKLKEVTVDANNRFYAQVIEERKRGNAAHFERFDINGNFIIENTDERGRILIDAAPDGQINFRRPQAGVDYEADILHHLESEYVDVLFTLYSPTEMFEEDLYIYGGLTDWEFKPEFKMVYNPAIFSYVGKVRLKQGYYDYIYAAVSKKTGEADFEVTEGDWHETENQYTVLLYYRPFGSRFDQLIGITEISSRN